MNNPLQVQYFRFLHFTFFSLLLLCSTPLLARHDTLQICRGESVQLAVDPNFATYRWQPVVGLSNPTIPNPVAVPQVTTTYIVESIPSNGQNLITNGDFSNGNTGFTSQYTFSPGANPTQGVYGVFTDANQLSPMYFEHCRDHTTQTGPLMAVDGSPVADLEVWCQTIAIVPDKTYAFSTWLTSILQPNPAILRFSINGTQIGETFIAGTQNCQWRQFYEIWNSGAATQAEICVVNRNTNPQGNDFALDDFAFFEIGTPVYDTITVVVYEPELTVVDTSFCADELIDYQGMLLPVSAAFSLQYVSRFGCDSVVQYRAEIIDTVTVVQRVDTLCPGEILPFFGHLINRDTFLCETLSNSVGCDTTICLQAVFLTETALFTEQQDPSCFAADDGSISLDVQAGLPPFQYRWENGNTQVDRVGLRAGFYQIAVTDSKGCRAVKSIALTEPPLLSISANGSSTLCNGSINGIITITASGGTMPYQYAVDGGQDFGPESQFSGLAPGSYTIVVADAQQCMATSTIQVPPPLQVTLNVPLNGQIRLGEVLSISITDNSPTALQYEWIPADGVACPTCATTTIQPFSTTTYTIRATDAFGCSVEAYWRVEVTKDKSVYIPNAFSPNGDGVNDAFRLYTGLGVAEILDFSIYDRWGNQVYFQANCSADCVWDGTWNGRPLGQDVYVFMARLLYLDGEVVPLSGEVNLLW